MSQRDSGYVRKERDAYETPEWVTRVLIPHIPYYVKDIWEPAAGSGKMSKVLTGAGFSVRTTDIESGDDFLDNKTHINAWNSAIITNPPYKDALKFIDCSMQRADFVAMLLRVDYDSASTRKRLFTDTRFSKKIVLTRRIKWIEDSTGSPSYNHAWFIWDTKHQGPATISYGP